MTVNVDDTIERNTVAGVGPYPFSFRIFGETDLAVTACSAASPSVPTLLTYLTHYTVTGANDADGGEVTLTAPVAATYAGYTLDIRSNTPHDQPTNIRNQGRFLPEIHEDALDHLERQMQDAFRQLRACVRYPDNVLSDGMMTPLSAWVSKYLTIDSNGNLTPAVLSATTVTAAIVTSLLAASTADQDTLLSLLLERTDTAPGLTSLKRTAAEIAAAVTPSNFAYPPLNPYRYGADGAGGASDNTAMTRVRSVVAQLTNITEWLNGLSVMGWEQTAAEALAGVVPNFRYEPDSNGRLSVFRYMSQAQIAAVQGGANTVDVSAAIQAANDYLEGRRANCILTLTVSAGGAGYTNGFYPCVAMSGGSGTNAKCAITVAGGAITSCVPAGPYTMAAGSVVATGVAVTHTVPAAGLGNYTVGNAMAPIVDASPTSPLYFPAGGAGATITVATVSVAGGKTVSGLPQGGRLYFPPGYYYSGNFSLRVGSFVRWEFASLNSVQFAWHTAFTGVGIYIGPDQSGYYGFIGYYAMGSQLGSFTANHSVNMPWTIFADGIQQNCFIDDLWLQNVTYGGIALIDNKGGADVSMGKVYVIGAAVMPTSAGNPVGRAVYINYGGNVKVDSLSLNGGGSAASADGIFNKGIDLQAGNLILSDYQAEEVLTALDIPATFLSYAVSIDRALITNTSFGVPRGIWIHAGGVPLINAQGITGGAGIIAIQNDNTGYVANPGAANGVPKYVWSKTFNSSIENVIVSGVREVITYVSGGTMVPDVYQGGSHIIGVTTVNNFTIGAPLYCASAMPAAGLRGRRITMIISNNGAGVMGVITWNAVFKMSAWTNPANGFYRAIDFEWDNAHWQQVGQTGVDIPN